MRQCRYKNYSSYQMTKKPKERREDIYFFYTSLLNSTTFPVKFCAYAVDICTLKSHNNTSHCFKQIEILNWVCALLERNLLSTLYYCRQLIFWGFNPISGRTFTYCLQCIPD